MTTPTKPPPRTTVGMLAPCVMIKVHAVNAIGMVAGPTKACIASGDTLAAMRPLAAAVAPSKD
jgi:hypothetical protein